jgi:hypothetical protein
LPSLPSFLLWFVSYYSNQIQSFVRIQDAGVWNKIGWQLRGNIRDPLRGIFAASLNLPPMLWHEMFDFSEDCVVLVLAEDYYEERDYIRSYEQFRVSVRK